MDSVRASSNCSDGLPIPRCCQDMAKMDAASVRVILFLILASASMPALECSQIPAPVAREEDVQFIKCQVCQKLASLLYDQVQSKLARISEKATRKEIIQIAKNLCLLEKEEANWIRKIDIVEQGAKLELVDQGIEGICNSECRTIEKACQQVIENPWPVLKYLSESKPTAEGLAPFLCKNVTDSCTSEPPLVPKGRTPGEAFVPKEADGEKTVASTEDMPEAPTMNAYPTDVSTSKKSPGEEENDEEDEAEDDHSKWGLDELGKKLKRVEEKVVHAAEKFMPGDSEGKSETVHSEL